jgi:hypothetical protein
MKSSMQPKPPEDILADPSIINLIKQTCIRLGCEAALEIIDVARRLYARLLIEVNSSPMVKDKHLFETGAALTYICPHNNSG